MGSAGAQAQLISNYSAKGVELNKTELATSKPTFERLAGRCDSWARGHTCAWCAVHYIEGRRGLRPRKRLARFLIARFLITRFPPVGNASLVSYFAGFLLSLGHCRPIFLFFSPNFFF